MRIPEFCPISEMARDARGLVERARQRQEPIVVTQRGREVAVILPIELYRDMQRRSASHIVSPRLARKKDADLFKMEMAPLDAEG